ncbi:hypothetical protein OG912_11350 [Streptomyces sp. NBC_00464]|uniref:hypothetical protein n=1 Tax=Streptomyces sp. NBC_00464 TaxID=2975751 RepID=UPI002E16F442
MKRTFRLAVGVAIAAGSVAVTAPTATASEVGTASIDCKTGKSGSAPYYAFARCNEMGSWAKFRVHATCVDPRGGTWIVNGPWMRKTQTSIVKCSDSPNVGILKIGLTLSN